VGPEQSDMAASLQCDIKSNALSQLNFLMFVFFLKEVFPTI
jgi:hypothetical protein